MENRDLETEADHNDDIVEDHGFSGSRGAKIGSRVQKEKKLVSNSNVQLGASLKTKMKDLYSYEKPSEYLCDGDGADDKEILDSADPEDDIVEDFGFSGSRNARGQVRMSFVQLDSKVKAPESVNLLEYPINADHMNLLFKQSQI